MRNINERMDWKVVNTDSEEDLIIAVFRRIEDAEVFVNASGKGPGCQTLKVVMAATKLVEVKT